MSSVIGGSSNQVGVSNPTLPANIDDHPAPLARYGAVEARSRAASLPPSYTITWDTTPIPYDDNETGGRGKSTMTNRQSRRARQVRRRMTISGTASMCRLQKGWSAHDTKKNIYGQNGSVALDTDRHSSREV